jgi:hypothetical protein
MVQLDETPPVLQESDIEADFVEVAASEVTDSDFVADIEWPPKT